jgi:glycerol-3-phosphate dehydrogenase
MWTAGWRDEVWARLSGPWDILIIGGGITGAGILREATRIGLRALLLEANDFASGTSGRSSKLVHGGLRYLRHGQLGTTIASVGERNQLLREGKGLVTPLGFVYAAYRDDRLPLWLFGMGLAVYDVLGLRWGHKRYAPRSLGRLLPHLNQDRLVGGYRYFDAQTDDARLVLRVIREAVAHGGIALNYARVDSLLRSADGRVRGAVVRDTAPAGPDHRLTEVSGRTAEVEAAVVVNATGEAADGLRLQLGGRPRLRTLRGSHLVFSDERLPLTRALSFAHPADGRPVFALPWEGVSLFGTTDVDHRQEPGVEPSISSGELAYLLDGLRHAFPALDLAERDVQATFAGVRAVVDTGKSDPSRESREHIIWKEQGLLTVSGGKLTTFRVMAHDALRAVRAELPRHPGFRLHRVLESSNGAPGRGLNPSQRLRLAGRYGREAADLVAAAEEGELVSIEGSSALWAELRWAARAEGVVHLDDLLLRRVRLALLLPQGGLPWLERFQAIVQPELGWSDRRWSDEVEAYSRRLRRAYGLPSEE